MTHENLAFAFAYHPKAEVEILKHIKYLVQESIKLRVVFNNVGAVARRTGAYGYSIDATGSFTPRKPSNVLLLGPWAFRNDFLFTRKSGTNDLYKTEKEILTYIDIAVRASLSFNNSGFIEPFKFQVQHLLYAAAFMPERFNILETGISPYHPITNSNGNLVNKNRANYYIDIASNLNVVYRFQFSAIDVTSGYTVVGVMSDQCVSVLAMNTNYYLERQDTFVPIGIFPYIYQSKPTGIVDLMPEHIERNLSLQLPELYQFLQTTKNLPSVYSKIDIDLHRFLLTDALSILNTTYGIVEKEVGWHDN